MLRVGEQPESQGAEEAADQVDADHVEGVVVAELVLQRDGEVADDADPQADVQRGQAADEAGARGDGDQAGHRTRSRRPGWWGARP